MKRLALVAGALLLLTASVPAQQQPPGIAPCKPGMNVYPSDEAYRPKFPRAYPGAPPVLPHGAAATQVKLKENECIDCHTPPESHYFNPYTGKKTPDKVVRFYCTQCRVPQAGEMNLVVQGSSGESVGQDRP